MLLMYGSADACKYVVSRESVQVFGFNTLLENVVNLNLIPPNTLGAINEYDFDIKYFQYVMGDDMNFIRMFGIPIAMFNGYDIFIISDKYSMNSSWEENLIESFLKILQTRYGFMACLVNSPEDYEYASETDFDLRYGVQNMDYDYKRYVEICKRLGDEYGITKQLEQQGAI